ncbi:MAG: hypothetical protein ACE5KM_21550 [Planctomycetaceae bacterium]
MEALKTTFNQYSEIYAKLSASQRMMVFVIVALVVGALGYVVFNSSSGGYVPASLGKNFQPEEMRTAQAALREQGLSDFKQEGNQLLVPKREVDRYNVALLEGGGLPADWASELEKGYDKDGWFPSDRQTRQRKEIALARELRRVLRAHPDIEDASVVWASSKPRHFSGRSPKVTATVSIKPKSGRELSPRLAASMRLAVANMIADLKPDNVTIFNLRTGESFTSDTTGPYSTEFLALIKQYTKMYRQKVEGQLSFIPDVLVSVDVQLNDLAESIERSKKYDRKNTVVTDAADVTRTEDSTNRRQRAEAGVVPNQPRDNSTAGTSGQVRKVKHTDKSTSSVPSVVETFKRYIPAMRKVLKVSVGIPEEYFQKVAEKQSAAGGGGTAGGQPAPTRDAILADVKKMVEHTIGAQPNTDTVEVRQYVRVDRDVPEMTTPFSESAWAFLSQWAGPIGLGIFALWALWMVRKSMPQLPAVTQDPLAALAAPASDPEPAELEPQSNEIIPTERDRVQSAARDNPELAAAVVSQWLKAAG